MADARTDFFDSGADTSAADQDARTAFFSSDKAQSETKAKEAADSPSNWWEKVKGAGETALHLGTSVPASLGGGLNYLGTLAATGGDTNAAQSVQQGTQEAMTYQPRTQTGQQYSRGVSDVMMLPDQFGERLGERNFEATGSPAWATAARMAPDVLATLFGLRKAAGAGAGAVAMEEPPRIEPTMGPSPQIPPASLMGAKQSMGAAAALPDLTNVRPELRQQIETTLKDSGGNPSPEYLQAATRHVEADTLPVPMEITEGQATGNVHLISDEMNKRGKFPELADRINSQNGKLIQNIQAVRDNAGPDVFSTNPVEHADKLIGAYKEKGAAADAVTDANYQALRDANGGQFPVSAPQLLENATAQLHKQLLFDHAPKAIMSTLGRLAEGDNMTFENFESLRTNLARIQRSKTADGNEIAAAGIIRNAMEELPLQAGAEELKPIADKARASARAQFQALEADPAYKAAVNDTVAPDAFVQKFVIGAPRDKVMLMRNNLSHDPTAVQTMSVAAIDHLRKSAGIDSAGNGNFSQAGFNKNLEALSPKLQALVDPQTGATLQQLGNVARTVQVQPRGSYVNNSNTAVSLVKEHAAGAAEGAINYAFHGLPIGTVGRKIIGKRSEQKIVDQSLEPGAGLKKLSDMSRP